jgi:hypothetical protein
MTARIFYENSESDGDASTTFQALSPRFEQENREYLCKEKADCGCAPAIQRHTLIWIWSDNRGGFSFDGHRLSSLYRVAMMAKPTLTICKRAAFSL